MESKTLRPSSREPHEEPGMTPGHALTAGRRSCAVAGLGAAAVVLTAAVSWKSLLAQYYLASLRQDHGSLSSLLNQAEGTPQAEALRRALAAPDTREWVKAGILSAWLAECSQRTRLMGPHTFALLGERSWVVMYLDRSDNVFVEREFEDFHGRHGGGVGAPIRRPSARFRRCMQLMDSVEFRHMECAMYPGV
jgi:hypothetical protein